MMRNILLLLLVTLTCCKSQSKWEGGEITKVGVYEYEGLKLTVTDKDYILDYFMLDEKGDTLLASDEKFSSFQRWALHLDKEKKLWVFSSDIGDACWSKGTAKKEYVKKMFVGLIPKDSLPLEVYNTLKHFHPYSSQK